MLEKEANAIDAVFVATPDFYHSEHVRAVLRKGKHVYCSAPLAHVLFDAKEMVREHEASGKIMQVGYTRRSNPRYRHAIENCIRRELLLGRITHASTQCHRAVSSLWGFPKREQVPLEALQKYGYANMEEFINWRWFPSYGAGQLMTLGVDGLDVCLWAGDFEKVSAIAIGGNDYYHRAVNEDGIALFEFRTRDGQTTRVSCHVVNTSSLGGTYEELMGEQGSLRISPIPLRGNTFKREQDADVLSWNLFESRGELAGPISTPEIAIVACGPSLRVVVGRVPNIDTYWLQGAECDLGGYYHVENFIQTIRCENPSMITCPPATALRTEKAMYAACESLTTKGYVNVELGKNAVP